MIQFNSNLVKILITALITVLQAIVSHIEEV